MHFLSVGKIESEGETYYGEVQSLGGWCALRVQLKFLFFKNYLLCVCLSVSVSVSLSLSFFQKLSSLCSVNYIMTIYWSSHMGVNVRQGKDRTKNRKTERQKEEKEKERERRRNINQDSIKEEKAHTCTGFYWRWTEPWRKSNGREINEKNIEEHRKGWNIQRQKDGNAKKQLKMKTVGKGGKIKIDRKNNTVKNKINKSQII